MTIRPITPIVPMLSNRSYSCGSFHVLFVIQVVKKMNFLEGRLSLRKQHVQVFLGNNLGKNIDSLLPDNFGVGTNLISCRTF
jgi:hypothetical protein